MPAILLPKARLLLYSRCIFVQSLFISKPYFVEIQEDSLAAPLARHSPKIREIISSIATPFLTCAKTVGPSPLFAMKKMSIMILLHDVYSYLIFFASRAMTSRSAPMMGAKSVLLTINRSLWVIPGPFFVVVDMKQISKSVDNKQALHIPPFLGTLSPPATSIT